MRYPYYPQQQSDPLANGLGLLGTILGQGYAQRGEEKRDKAQLDALNYVQGLQVQDPNGAIGTNYDTIQQLTQNPNVKASEFKKGNIPTDADFLKELTDDYNAKNIDAATKTIQGLVPGWQAYQQSDPTKYKADMQTVVDNNGNNNAGLLSGLQGIARQHGTGGTFGNDVQYLADQTGDPLLLDATKTQQQLNDKPTVAITPQYIKQQIYSKQGEILQKLHSQGVNLKEAMPMVKQMLDERVTTLTDQQADKDLTPLQGNLDTALDNANDPQQKTAVMKAVMQYNAKAHQYGRQTLDTGIIKYALESNDAVIQKEDNGAQYRYVMTRKDGRPFGVDAQGQPIYQQQVTDWNDKQVSPDTQARLDNSKDIALINASNRGTRVSGSNGNRGTIGSSGSGVTEAQYKSAIVQRDRFVKWQQDNPEKDSSEYPYWGQLDYANGVIDRRNASANTDNGNNDEGQDTTGNDNSGGAAWYDQQVRAVMAGKGVDQATAEEIVSNYIRAQGG